VENKKNKSVEIIAPIEVEGVIHKEIATVFDIPAMKKRQPDLQYFTAIFVSSGKNLNNAYFLPSELLSARDSIVSKAIDIEHDEQNVIGHIYDKAYMWKDHKVFDPTSIKSAEEKDVEEMEMDIAIAGITYRERFPDVAKEIEEGKWKISMECYYEDFDVRVGNVTIPGTDALALGYDAMIGNFVIVKDKGDEIVQDTMVRILKGILFSGCGLVEKPANPPSVIMDVASLEKKVAFANKENLIINLENCETYLKNKQEDEKIELNSSSKAGEDDDKCKDCPGCKEDDEEDKEKSNLATEDDLGLSGPCPMFKRWIYDETSFEVNKPVLHEDWCTRYEEPCPVFSQDATAFNCLKWRDGEVLAHFVAEVIEEEMDSKFNEEAIENLIEEVKESIEIAKTHLDKSAKWNRKYINGLPNAAFAVVEPAYTSGKTDNKNARHLPHHTGPGGTSNKNLDLPHLKNAMARSNQVKPVTDSISQAALRKKAVAHLENHRGALKTSK